MITSSSQINFVKEYITKTNLDKKITLTEIFDTSDFKKEYNKIFLKSKILHNQNYIIKIIKKMLKDNIYNANNQTQGLDGFSIELKLDKGTKSFYSWCIADDKRYFYVINFINYVLDEIGIDKEYRIKKAEYI